MLIEVKQLVKRYKELIALDHFDFHLEEGEIVGLLGPNGSGKTTSINCMLSLLKYDKGDIRIFGKEMRPDDWESKAKIGVVPQELAYFDSLSVRDNVDYFCGLYIKDARERKRLVEEAIDFTGLKGYEKFTPPKLSGGLKRRLNIACGIAHKPKLLFLDEPTVAVDAQSRNFILEGVAEMNRQGASVVYTSHYLEEVQQLCRRIVIMDKGKNLVQGTTSELLGMINTSEKIHLKLAENPEGIREKITALPQVVEVSAQNEKDGFVIKFEKGVHHLTDVLDLIKDENLVYTELYSERPTLNDVFLELTGKGLRE